MEKSFLDVNGLRFSCKRCSSCCREASGYVFLSDNDLQKLASVLKMDKKSIIAVYCRWVTDWKGEEVLSLKEKSNMDCILWDNGCTVYTSRPLQCITFPFWDSVIATEQNWEIAASGCPGMNSGDLHTKYKIDENIKLRISQPIINRLQIESAILDSGSVL
jgi:hypothetical protein